MNHELNQLLEGKMREEAREEKKEVRDKAGCSAVGYQDVNVSIPITIKPFGEVGNSKTQCLGKPVVTSGIDECTGKHDKLCKFTISQKLRVEVPVIFGARAEVGDATVDCGCAESVCDCK